MLDNLKTVFITGTDTGVGKSIFTVFLALSYLGRGKKIAIVKPLQTGLPKDTDFLKALIEDKIPFFNTYSFLLPAAPRIASKHENKTIDVKKIISDIKELENQFDHVIVEGIGGIAVPITDCGTDVLPCNDVYLVADLIKDLNYPVIVVARPSLGTINHTVLTIELAKQKGLHVLGFVISGYDERTNDTVIKTAPDAISDITKIKCLIKIPYIREITYDSICSVTREVLSSSNTPNVRAKAYPINL